MSHKNETSMRPLFKGPGIMSETEESGLVTTWRFLNEKRNSRSRIIGCLSKCICTFKYCGKRISRGVDKNATEECALKLGDTNASDLTWKASLSECIRILSRSLLSNRRRFLSRAERALRRLRPPPPGALPDDGGGGRLLAPSVVAPGDSCCAGGGVGGGVPPFAAAAVVPALESRDLGCPWSSDETLS